MKKIKTKSQLLIIECDNLWKEIIKFRAGYKCELTGLKGRQIDKDNGCILDAHHLIGKSNYALRYNLDNGICLARGKHIYNAHNESRKEQFKQEVITYKGYDIYTELRKFKFKTSTSLEMYKLYLTHELKKLKNKSRCDLI